MSLFNLNAFDVSQHFLKVKTILKHTSGNMQPIVTSQTEIENQLLM